MFRVNAFPNTKILLLMIGIVVGAMIPVITWVGEVGLDIAIVFFIFLMAVVIFKNPTLGIVFLALTTAFSYSFSVGMLPGREIEIRTDDLLLIATLGALTLSVVRRDGKYNISLCSPIGFIFLILVLQGLFSTFFNILFRQLDLKELIVASFYWSKYSQYLVIFFLTTWLIRTNPERKQVLGALALGLAVIVVWGVIQVISDNYALRSMFNRVAMPFDIGPNVMGAYLVVVIPPLFSITTTKSLQKQERRALLLLLLISTILVFFTGSRASVIGFVFALVAIIGLRFIQHEISGRAFIKLLSFVFVFALIILLLGLFPTPVRRLFMFDRYSVFDARIDSIWIPLVERTLSRNPILGNGIMLFDRNKAENYFVRLFSEQGFVGLGLFSILMVLLSRIGIRVSRFSQDPIIRKVAIGFVGSIIGLLFASFWSDKFIVVRIMTPFWILGGIVVGSYQKNYEKW